MDIFKKETGYRGENLEKLKEYKIIYIITIKKRNSKYCESFIVDNEDNEIRKIKELLN